MSITFLRRKGLGGGSIKGMVGFLNEHAPEQVSALAHIGEGVNVIRNDKIDTANGQRIKDGTEWLVRWGCTTGFGFKDSNTINLSKAIKQVAHKRDFRMHISDVAPELAPFTVYDLDQAEEANWHMSWPLVLRSPVHAQGRNLWLVNDMEELSNKISTEPSLAEGWYASEYVKKVSEYRVYVVSGRVTTVAKKTPDDPNAVAWNVAQGGRFDVVRFGDWDLNAVHVAVKAFNHTSLDFGGVDIMVDEDGRAYLIEINSSPSLPIMVEGKTSYRQQCMAKAFMHICENGKNRMSCGVGNWKNYIHPAISPKAIL